MPNNPCMLTTKDYTILEVMLERCLGLDDPMRPILQQKLHNAVVVFADDIPATVVTLNSRVAYRVNGGPAETRIVAHDDVRGLVGRVISITIPRGLALLGLAEGQSFRVLGAGEEHENACPDQHRTYPGSVAHVAYHAPYCCRDVLRGQDALGGGLLSHHKASDFEGKLDQLIDVPTFGRVKSRA